MKFSFKKITSVLASAVMLGSTIGFAAAASYPAPFVQGGMANVGIVVGSNADGSDYMAAASIGQDLASELAAQSATGGSGGTSSTVSGGDYVKLSKSTDLFNLGDSMNTFYTSLDSDELSTVLADGIYTNDDNNEYEYDQKIELGGLQLTYFQDADFNDEKPIIGFDLSDGTYVMNYTLDFSPDNAEGGTAFASLETTDLTLLGRTYYIVDATSTTNGVKISLLDSANSAIITSGPDPTTVEVGDKSYNVAITYINGANDQVILDVDGVKTNKLSEGDVFKVDSDTYVAVKSNLAGEGDADIDQVEISIGSGKIILENGQEVKINNEYISNIDEYNDAVLKAYITNSSTDIDKIVLEWTLGDDTWIAPGTDLVLPGFETIKLSMAGFTMPGAEMTKLSNDGQTKAKLETTLEDGDVSFNILYANATNILGIGKDADDLLVTSSTTELIFNTTQDEWFVASWISGDDAESYLLKVTKIDDSDPVKNVTTIESQADGSTNKLTLDIGESDTFNNVKLTLNAASEDDKTVNLTIAATSGSGTASFNNLYTKDGLTIKLPVNSVAVGDGNINLSAYPTQWIQNFTEEDKDGAINSGESFTATWGITTEGKIEVSSVSVTDYPVEDDSDNYEGYVVSDLATKTYYATGGDQDTLDITYAGDESYADVYVSEANAVITALDTPTTGDASVKKLGSTPVFDDEVSSIQDRNIIVIGGSCINSVAAEILGGAYCGQAFTDETGVGADQFLIKVADSPYDATKTAMLVAGYEAADTTKAVEYVISDNPTTDKGTEKKLTSAAYAEVE